MVRRTLWNRKINSVPMAFWENLQVNENLKVGSRSENLGLKKG